MWNLTIRESDYVRLKKSLIIEHSVAFDCDCTSARRAGQNIEHSLLLSISEVKFVWEHFAWIKKVAVVCIN